MDLLTQFITHCLQADQNKTAQALRKEHPESIDKLVGWLDGFMTKIKKSPTAARRNVVAGNDTLISLNTAEEGQ